MYEKRAKIIQQKYLRSLRTPNASYLRMVAEVYDHMITCNKAHSLIGLKQKKIMCPELR